MLGKAGSILRPPGHRITNPLCKRCGGMHREYERLHRRHLGASIRRVCCCCPPLGVCANYPTDAISIELIGLDYFTGCNGIKTTLNNFDADGTYLNNYTPIAGDAAACTFSDSLTVAVGDITAWDTIPCTGSSAPFDIDTMEIELSVFRATNNIRQLSVTVRTGVGGYVQLIFRYGGIPVAEDSSLPLLCDELENEFTVADESQNAANGVAIVTVVPA
jgi:hypothetical protein